MQVGSAADDAMEDLWGVLVSFYISRITGHIDAVQRSLSGLDLGAGDKSDRGEGQRVPLLQELAGFSCLVGAQEDGLWTLCSPRWSLSPRTVSPGTLNGILGKRSARIAKPSL